MRNVRSTLTALLVAMLLPAKAPAQSAAIWRDSSARLGEAIRALTDSMAKGDSGSIEIARRGDLVMAASPNLRAEGLEAFDRVNQLRDRWFGDGRVSPSGFRLVVRIVTYPRANQPERQLGALTLAELPDTERVTGREVTVESAEAGYQMATTYFQMMFWGIPPDVGRWLAGPPGLWERDTEWRDETMYAFITGTGAAERECISGNMAGCSRALGFQPLLPGDSSRVFYPMVRADLMLTALEIGGKGAWQRAVHDPTSTAEQALVAAAGIPLDSLMARWRSGLLERRPNAPPVSGASAALAIAWTALLLLGATGAARWA